MSKWEAERAYPEMDKLLKMCALFECTLDELVTGDLTGRPANGVASIPPGKSQQDVTGYDQAMRVFAWKLPLGIAVIFASAALALILSDPRLMPIAEVRSFASALVFVGVAVGLALILPASFARGAFRKAHPFVDDFYTADQKSKARTALSVSYTHLDVYKRQGMSVDRDHCQNHFCSLLCLLAFNRSINDLFAN